MRRFVLALSLATGLAAPAAQAGDPVVFDLDIRGVLAGTLSFAGEAANGRYAVTGQMKSAGLFGMLRRARYDGQAEGSVQQGRFTPARYSEQADTGRRQSQSLMEYRGGVPQVKQYTPPREAEPDGLDPATQGGTVDPLTALFATLRDVPQDQACNRTLTMFDGARRSQLTLGAPMAVEGGLTCAGEYRRLDGFTEKEMGERSRFPFTLRLVPVEAGLLRVSEVTMETLYGAARLKRR